jgi:DNA-directed RNA polymerase
VFEALHPRYLPMLVRPRPWISYNEGGYLTLRSIIMRTRGSRSQLDSLRRAELTSLFAGLNVVAEVPWRINKPVFRVMEHMWEHGGGRCELPRRADDPLPPEPTVPEAEQPALWKKWRSECREVNKINRDLHSLRCDAQYKLEVARAFQDKAEFYFPCNLDFRGRAYPIPPHLNHIGADLARGILCFAEGKKLGERGLWWVKVHLANLCGFDKASFEDRVAFTEARMPDIMRAAEDPLKNDWWTEVESPWQCLATCFELAEALKLPNPADHVSHLPIHQDGSCNGLQHYAALGRDEAGGTAVNLTPGTKPNDVYMDVCKLVNAQVEKDAEAGNPIAKRLLGKITRKVVKQTVMTSVYGVTWVGARAQINARLDEIFTPSSERMQNFKASGYLAKITLDSLANLFTSAREIMNWLGECAQTVAMQGQPMSWVTPLGLPVVQPYRKRSHLHVQTLIQTVTLVDHNDQLPVSPQRQRSAFPPNFVHSLDSTHMLMTALECRDLGVTFTSVHDSFWTHACSVDVMNEALRRQFVQLYTSPILENLRDALARRFPEATFPPVPKRGSLDLGKVMASRYFFS